MALPVWCTRLLGGLSILVILQGLAAGAEPAAPPAATAQSADQESHRARIQLVAFMPNGASFRARWRSSLLGTLWSDPSTGWIRTQVSVIDAMLADRTGIDPFTILAATRSAAVVWKGYLHPAPDQDIASGPVAGHATIARAQADLGSDAVKIFAAIQAHLPPMPSQAPLAAVHLGTTGAMSLVGTTLVAGEEQLGDMGPTSIPPSITRDCAVLMVDGPGSSADAAGRMNLRWAWYPDFQAEGISERLVMLQTVAAMPAVDRQVLTRIPGNALSVVAMGIDGPALWKDISLGLMPRLRAISSTQDDPMTIITRLDAALAKLVPGLDTRRLLSGVNGTVVLAVCPGVPLPSVTVVLPRSEILDDLIAHLVIALDGPASKPPAEGASRPFRIPSFPLPVFIARDKTYWLLTTDYSLPQSWLAAKSGGWTQAIPGATVLRLAAGDSFLLGASDTKAVINTVLPFLGMALGRNHNMSPVDRQHVMGLVSRLAQLSHTGYIYGEDQPTGLVIAARGVLVPSTLASLAVLAVVPGSGPPAPPKRAPTAPGPGTGAGTPGTTPPAPAGAVPATP